MALLPDSYIAGTRLAASLLYPAFVSNEHSSDSLFAVVYCLSHVHTSTSLGVLGVDVWLLKQRDASADR